MKSSAIRTQVHVCFNNFKSLIDTIGQSTVYDQNQASTALLEDRYGRFRLWCGNMGAHRAGKASLDHRLRYSERITQAVLNILGYLSELLLDGKEFLSSDYGA